MRSKKRKKKRNRDL